jgi:hypothetical protein
MTGRKRAMDIIDKALHSSNIAFLTPRVLNFDMPEPDQVNTHSIQFAGFDRF